MTKKNLWALLVMLVLIIACSTTKKGIDKNGNPIFNSITIDEKEYDGYGISANYYTLINNIENPNSSVFVSEKPNSEQIFDFATNKPSYFWILHQNREVIKSIVLTQNSESIVDVKWAFHVIDFKNQTSKEFPINIKMLHITEHRVLELTHHEKMLEQELLDKEKRIFNQFFENKLHGTLPYLKVYEKLLKFIDENKLYLSETDILDVEFVDNVDE